jgi:hypothetical protein
VRRIRTVWYVEPFVCHLDAAWLPIVDFGLPSIRSCSCVYMSFCLSFGRLHGGARGHVVYLSDCLQSPFIHGPHATRLRRLYV